MTLSDAMPAPADSPELTTWKQFEVRERVGSGGFGDVYLAWDQQLRRPVALKLLRAKESDNDRLYAEVLHEARVLARIRHPNVVPVYGVDRDRGRIGFWSEFIRGRNLSQLLQSQGVFGEREAALIGMDICRAMSAVHAAGLLHRDIKAANVIREDGGRVLLMDFGMSHDTGRERHRGGTPNYMAPELFRAEEEPTVASDIYALGVLLFHLVTLQFPLEPDLRTGEWSKRRNLFDLRADLSPAFVGVVDRATHPEAAERFGSAGQMMAALSEAAGAAGTATHSPEEKRPFLWKWFGGLAVIGLAGAGAIYMQTGRQPDSAGGTNSNQAYLAATELLKRVDKPGNIDRAIEELKRILASEPRNALAAAGLARAYWLQYGAKREPKFLTMAKEASDLALGINPKLAPVHATLGKIQARMGNTDLADQELQQALALDPRSADVWSAMGDLYDSQGRKQQAEEAIQKAMALAPDDWRYANQMGLFQAAHGSPAQGIEAYREAARLTPDNYLPLNNLGIAYRNQGNLVEAEKALRRAVAINPGNRTYTNLGNVLSDAGRFGEAAEAYQQALRLNGASYLTWGNLAACYRRDGAPAAKVREAYQEAATRAEAERAAAPKDAVLAAMLGTYRLWLGERPRALQLARQAVALDGENPAVLVAAAEVFAHTGDRVEAISLLGGALAHGASKEEIARNRELEPLRGEPRFRALIGRNE